MQHQRHLARTRRQNVHEPLPAPSLQQIPRQYNYLPPIRYSPFKCNSEVPLLQNACYNRPQSVLNPHAAEFSLQPLTVKVPPNVIPYAENLLSRNYGNLNFPPECQIMTKNENTFDQSILDPNYNRYRYQSNVTTPRHGGGWNLGTWSAIDSYENPVAKFPPQQASQISSIKPQSYTGVPNYKDSSFSCIPTVEHNIFLNCKERVVASAAECQRILNMLPMLFHNRQISLDQTNQIEHIARNRIREMNWQINSVHECAPSASTPKIVESPVINDENKSSLHFPEGKGVYPTEDAETRYNPTVKPDVIIVHYKGTNPEVIFYLPDFELICSDGIVPANREVLVNSSAFFFKNLKTETNFLSITNRTSHELSVIVNLVTNGRVSIMKKNAGDLKVSIKFFRIRGTYFSDGLEDYSKVVDIDEECPSGVENSSCVELQAFGLPDMVKCMKCNNPISKQTFPGHYNEYHLPLPDPMVCCAEIFITKFDLAYHKRYRCGYMHNKLSSSWALPKSDVHVNNDLERPDGNAHSTPIDQNEMKLPSFSKPEDMQQA